MCGRETICEVYYVQFGLVEVTRRLPESQLVLKFFREKFVTCGYRRNIGNRKYCGQRFILMLLNTLHYITLKS